MDFIHNKALYGVEAICRILTIAASTYYRTLVLCDEKHCFAREHRAKRDLHDLHHSALGYVSPFDFEAMSYDKINPLGQVA